MPKPVAEWPLLLCGPMLRRVEPTSVSVFVALKHPRKVKLSIFPAETSTMALGEQQVDTRELGKYLHVCLVTVRFPEFSPLQPGMNYQYDVTFSALDTGLATETLASLELLEGLLPLGYEKNKLPTFALPPADLNHLKLAHASCRKPHGEHREAF